MNKAGRYGLVGAAVVIGALWLIKYVSESEMRRLDKEVDRLCAIDGRSVIYETAKIPASMFNEHGQPLVPQRRLDDKGFGYFMQSEETVLAGAGQKPRATLTRSTTRVIRTTDGKVLAEHVNYNRSGGYWLEGVPGIGRGKNCPGPVPSDFQQRVFAKE